MQNNRVETIFFMGAPAEKKAAALAAAKVHHSDLGKWRLGVRYSLQRVGKLMQANRRRKKRNGVRVKQKRTRFIESDMDLLRRRACVCGMERPAPCCVVRKRLTRSALCCFTACMGSRYVRCWQSTGDRLI